MYKERTAVGDGCNAEIARWHGDKVTRGPFVPWRMRQADVIGVREKLGQAEAVEPGAIVESGRIWRPGSRFEDFVAGQLDLETLKNVGRAVST